jgi:membrane-associated phospholipid phosphatase
MMKYLFGRERPDVATRAGGKWNGPLSYFNRDPRDQGIGSFDAFPSGHTATIFAAATTISDAYDEPWVSYVSYSIASGVAISRVMERTHWMSDCFVGGLIGILSTRVVEKFNSLPPSVTIEPAKFPHAYGVKVVVGM